MFIGYKHSRDNARSIAFSQRNSVTHLIEDETFNGNGIITNLIDYEDGNTTSSCDGLTRFFINIFFWVLELMATLFQPTQEVKREEKMQIRKLLSIRSLE
ncbi:hypothetical protein TNCV_3894401 [Trichonephila clavipes]|nr:hypothetical protein TNCV_3894401 [Trichonephila clavipes]